MKKKLVIALSVTLSVVVVALLVFGIVFFVVPPTLSTDAVVGVKWLETYSDEDTDKYLDFLQKNGTTEIYYKVTDFNNNIVIENKTRNDITREFITKANARGMKVYAYWDKTEWLTNQSAFQTVYESYKSYRNTFPEQKFEGLHISVLPTSMSRWLTRRRESLQSYLKDFIFFISDMCQQDKIKVDFEMVADIDVRGMAANVVDDQNCVFQFNSLSKTASEWIIDSADRVFVVNNSNDYKTIRDVSSSEFAYAKEQEKCIFYSFEIADLSNPAAEGDENDGTTYFTQNKRKLYNDIKKAGKDLGQEYGCCLSDVKSWFELKNN